jgi:hypothetical protein
VASAVPGQPNGLAAGALNVPIVQQDVEAYATEIAQARQTGIANNPGKLRVLWNRLHRNWVDLGHADKQPVKDIYRKAHEDAEAILGPRSLINFRPLPP